MSVIAEETIKKLPDLDSIIINIVKSTIEFLVNYNGDEKFICKKPDENHREIRTCIHSILRFHILAERGLCPNEGTNFCQHTICPYIIGYNIYLWGLMPQKPHSRRLERSGCSFFHEKKDNHHIRTVIFNYLDRTYGNVNIENTPAWQTVSKVYLFYKMKEVDFQKYPEKTTWCYNFLPTSIFKNTGKSTRNYIEMIRIPNDDIFQD